MSRLDPAIKNRLAAGIVIPAHPLALNRERKLDERRQRALTRYYLESGAGGLAVGVHSTQFQIRDPQVALYEPLLQLAVEEIERRERLAPIIRVAGIVGETKQAVREAEIASANGYHLGLLSAGGLTDWSDDQLLERTQAVAEVIPVFGFYLQPAVGGRELSYEYWRRFFEIEGVYAAKVACFDRYRTLDVMRAAYESDRRDQISLYTGNDDSIVPDLLTPFPKADGVRFVGGLLGQWAVWTSRAVELLERIKSTRSEGVVRKGLLIEGAQLTEANGAIFDVHNGFAGSIPGIHEVLRRQGLLAGTWCIDPEEQLSPGQKERIDRICTSYPHITDDQFVRDHLDEWLQ